MAQTSAETHLPFIKTTDLTPRSVTLHQNIFRTRRVLGERSGSRGLQPAFRPSLRNTVFEIRTRAKARDYKARLPFSPFMAQSDEKCVRISDLSSVISPFLPLSRATASWGGTPARRAALRASASVPPRFAFMVPPKIDTA